MGVDVDGPFDKGLYVAGLCEKGKRHSFGGFNEFHYFEYLEDFWRCSHAALCVRGTQMPDEVFVDSEVTVPVGYDCYGSKKYFNNSPIMHIDNEFWACGAGNLCSATPLYTTSEPADDGLSAGAIAGIVTAGIVVAAGLAGAAIGLCICWWRSRNRGNENQRPEEVVGLRDIEANQREGRRSGAVMLLEEDGPAVPSSQISVKNMVKRFDLVTDK